MASKNISFDQIPSSIRKPGKYFEFNTKLAVRTLPNNKQAMLIIGQRTSAGTVAQNVLTRIFSDKEAETYFGAGSMAHLMARAAIRANPYLQLTVVALDDAVESLAATANVNIYGQATSSGVLTVYVGAAKVEIAIATGSSPDEIAAELAAEISAHPDLPVTAATGSGEVASTVIFTAKNKGLCGNDIGLGCVQTNASGVGVAIAPLTEGEMTGGAVNPDIWDALAAAFAYQYDVIAFPYNNQADLATLKTYLDSVSGPMEQRPGVGVYGMNGAFATCTTLSGQSNGGRVWCGYHRYTSSTPRKSMPYEIAAAYAAVVCFEEDPARPLDTLPLAGIAPAGINDRLSRTEQEMLLYNGTTPLEVGPGEVVQIVRAVTTYIHDPQGIDDSSLLDGTTIRTLDYVRKACRERIALRFPREKLSSKAPPRVRSELLDVLLKLEQLEIVEDVEANKDGLIVERDLQDVNRLNARIPADVVNGLHIFAGRIDLLL